MQLSLDNVAAATNRISGYGRGFVTVNEQRFARSLVVTINRLIPNWPPSSPSELVASHLQMVAALRPGIVLLGTGELQVFPDPALIEPFLIDGVGFEVMNTAAACRTYNILIAEGRNVAAALLIATR